MMIADLKSAGNIARGMSMLGRFRLRFSRPGLASRYPYRTNVTISFFAWYGGDVCAQTISSFLSQEPKHSNTSESYAKTAAEAWNEDHSSYRHRHRDEISSKTLKPNPQSTKLEPPHNTNLDYSRAWYTGVFGAAGAPIELTWLMYLQKVIQERWKIPAASFRSMILKTTADHFVMGPPMLFAYMTFLGFVEGQPFEATWSKIQQDFLPTFISQSIYWPMFQSFNFRFVPAEHQLLAINSFVFFDAAVLSWVRHSDDPFARLKGYVLPKSLEKQ